MKPPQCPACLAATVDDEGALPSFRPNFFGGMHQDVTFTAGHLMQCPNCDLRFRHPVPSVEELTRLYANLPDAVWESQEARPYWPLALRMLEKHAPNCDVLDVGCFGGDMLNWLPAEWRKHGVEPSRAASELATRRGIKILGRTAEELQPGRDQFGVVTSFDVIEHITTPVRFLTQLRDVLAPGGCLVLLTGATDSLPYCLFGRHYWYGSLPEHVTFYSRAWFGWAAKHLGMKVTTYHYLSSERREWVPWGRQFLQHAVYASVQLARERGIRDSAIGYLPVIGRAVHWSLTPWWKQATDHIMIVLTKEK